MPSEITQSYIKKKLPTRHKNANKHDFGCVLVVGGDYGMPGSVRLAGEAALHGGAGLVKVATHKEHLDVVCSSCPELMFVNISNPDDLKAQLEWCNVIAIGPGLGKSNWSRAVLAAVLSSDKPKVIDADALNILSEFSYEKRKKYLDDNCIFTPHVGEASRLIGWESEKINSDRVSVIQKLCKLNGGVNILKGSGTLISDGKDVVISNTGNPAMASAGMGDVLTGIIAAFIGQGLSFFDAAKCGVYCHGLAGDLAAKNFERGITATDVISHITEAVNLI